MIVDDLSSISWTRVFGIVVGGLLAWLVIKYLIGVLRRAPIRGDVVVNMAREVVKQSAEAIRARLPVVPEAQMPIRREWLARVRVALQGAGVPNSLSGSTQDRPKLGLVGE
jgi:hypothetical protein